MRVSRWQLLVRISFALALTGAACGTGEITYVLQASPPSATVTIALVPEPEAAGFAGALGWGSAIPDAEVSVIPVDSSAAPVVLRSSSTGQVLLPDLKPGTYLARVQRPLLPAEMATLPPAEGVEGWATLARITVSAQTSSLHVPVQASRRKSLIINEWFLVAGQDPRLGFYNNGQYVELYNNADTTVYLDRMRLGKGLAVTYDYPTFPCILYNEVVTDPTSVWTIDVQEFPGSGHDYPVAPGQVVLVALDGIDHRGIAQGAPDLSHADFELSGAADVDNPAVPNLVSVGIRGSSYNGFVFSVLAGVAFLSLPVEPAELRPTVIPGLTYSYERYPRAKLLDVVTYFTNWDRNTSPPCPRMVHPEIDQEPARAWGSTDYAVEYQQSLHRVPLRPGAWPRLQHIRNSAADFVVGQRSPGTLDPAH